MEVLPHELQNSLMLLEVRLMMQLNLFHRIFRGSAAMEATDMIERCIDWIQDELKQCAMFGPIVEPDIVCGVIAVGAVSSCLDDIIMQHRKWIK